MRLQSAIFDMDGTLLDSMHIWHELGPCMLYKQGITPTSDLHEKLKTMTLRQGAAYCKEAYGMPQSVEDIVSLIEEQIFDFYHNQVQAKPGVEKFLSLLKMEGVWMYVATATDRHLAEAALRHAGIDGYFRGIITCAEAGSGKSSPEIYERAMRRLQSNKKDTVVFEDALHAIQTAKAAGFRVCAVYDASAEEDQAEIRRLADYYLTSFEEMFETHAPD
ncbi:HAD family phosphatase [Oscillibacter sp.]|uniref:HAD family hydrolase n=1 Tax=Oscillibacter sp. TaxID=1945593 RepID=UPI002601AD34|nr:HAD family phosphatase [Oscillibacter sp.]MDD3346110.1 HAD family phosphatase [Oscillibacter sp.]